jgi:hypothetical protein
MSPRPKTYDTPEEQAEAHRQRQKKYIEKKRGLRQKLSDIANDIDTLEAESLEPKVVKVVMDTNSIEGSGSPNKLDSEERWRSFKCSYCQQFQSKEEVEYAKIILGHLSILPSDINKRAIFDEELAKFRSGNPSKIVRHKLE